MDRNEAINTLRRSAVAAEMWAGIASEGIIGPLTADVEHSAFMGLRKAARDAHQQGITVDEIANEGLIPYNLAFLLTR